ncbi:MAG: redox-regulated ATPase YchF [Thermoplasmata archaeon]|nr:MAG: redox-regulated ATPase YchF [Thermoplasmata archaeon]
MEVGVVGKPNVGKSTFFSAATLAKAEIASYPFTTIEANRGVMYVRAKCPHVDFETQCNPRNSHCENGTRLVPVEAIDVAGLVPDAHKGKGLGNKFLDDLRQAAALVHIVDASGSTDSEGNPCEVGSHDPMEDVEFLEREINQWIKGILFKDWHKLSKQVEMSGTKLERIFAEKLTGLGITEGMIYAGLRDADLGDKPTQWSEEDLLLLSHRIRAHGKPMIIAANKCEIAPEDNLKKLKELEDYIVIPTCAEVELALRRASKGDMIDYVPGSDSFKIQEEKDISEAHKKALEKIQHILDKIGNTGVQKCVEEAVFKLLDLIVVYPVEDETHLTDKDGRVLPDAYLMKRGATAVDLAFKVHTDLGNNFIRAIDARTKRVVGHDHELKDGDVIKIVANA